MSFWLLLGVLFAVWASAFAMLVGAFYYGFSKRFD